MGDASSSAEYDAFLTHDWGDDELGRSNHARVAEVNRLLKAAGFVTWFDEDRMQGDITKDADMPSPHRELLLSAARRRQSVRATVHAVSAVNYLSAAARRTKLLALAAKLRSWRRATRLALAVIVALAALVAALYSPLQAYV